MKINVKRFLKKYLFFIITLIILGILFIFKYNAGLKAVDTVIYNLRETLIVLPPIFILIGLLDVWVSKETMIRLMGEGSGFKGIALAFFIGIMTIGPLYTVWPIAIILMRKHVKFSNIMVLIGASAAIRIPMFLFEISSLGYKFALIRLFLNILVVLIIAYIMEGLIKKDEINVIYKKAENLLD